MLVPSRPATPRIATAVYPEPSFELARTTVGSYERQSDLAEIQLRAAACTRLWFGDVDLVGMHRAATRVCAGPT